MLGREPRQLFETADAVKAAGATILRGGAFKPRTSPYSFQGLGVEGLRYLAEARERTGLPIITEVMEPSQVDIVAEYADILQIGTRNMQNYSLLREMGRVARPVMLKRGYGATIEEWLMAAEYIVCSGNPNVILCERGIRTFETYTRNTMDLAAVPLLHHLTHLPVIVDPSHATGKRWLVKPLALGGVAVGADGVMVEVHPTPDEALSDAEQQLTLDQFRDLMTDSSRSTRRSAGCTAHPSQAGAAHGGRALGEHERASDDPHATSPRSDPPPDCAASCGCPATSRSATGRCCSRPWRPGRAASTGAGDGADVRSTAGIMRALGARVEPDGEAEGAAERGGAPGRGRNVDYRVESPGADGLRQPAGILDCGNSGTSLRLITGMLAGLPMTVRPGRGRLVASPTGRSYHRATAPDGRGAPRATTTTPSLPSP